MPKAWRRERAMGLGRVRQGKRFFFEKKSQETFAPMRYTVPSRVPKCAKVFWFFFSKKNCLLSSLTLATSAACAQPDPHQIFAPLPLPQPAGLTRSAAGVPAPGYWQNRADYTLAARIDTAKHVITATETINYTNNSPDPLSVLWLQLDQNIYRRDARSVFLPQYEPRGEGDYTEGYQLDKITVEFANRAYAPGQMVTDTRLQLRLDAPLAAHGGAVRIHIAYHYTMPGAWGGRTAFTHAQAGDIYEVAQWFPRMAVYDDLRGWDTQPYLGSEFYLDYGDIDYSVTVPWNYLVAGSGELQNPGDVLTATQRARLAQAAGSDATVMIRGADEIGKPESRPRLTGELTWHFRMHNTRDVAFAASPAFLWDAARINLPQGAHALAMSLYPAEGVGPQKWNRSTEYAKAAIERFSQRWFTYPWPVMVSLGGHGADMEYPGIVFDDMHEAGKELFWVTSHEVGHSWFPMIVGSNERRNAWMDEGFNTFIDVYQSDDFNKGEYAPKRDAEYAEHGGNPADEILPLLQDRNAPVILTDADVIGEAYRHPVSYFKPALGLVLLREQILGPQRFDQAFRKYIAGWAFKHPAPDDFFRLMSSEAGEDLSWWWRGWYMENTPLNMSLDSATYVNGHAADGLHVQMANHGGLVMPAPLAVAFKDGTHETITVPVEAWLQGNTAGFDLPTSKPVTSITLDPDHKLPNADRSHATINLP
jgi:hypothetical protein